MIAYYNEIDPFVAQWLRNLIAAGHIAAGDVDERSIAEVRPDDLRGYQQCHFFAGIGGWSLALRLAGWPDDRPVWTGSCPCQPFSQAGAQRGSADERHLWPAFFGLISECRPGVVFGEQVAGASGLAWLDHVCADLEGAGYAAAAANLCAAGAGAPHIRQRLYWVADAGSARTGRDAGTAPRAQAGGGGARGTDGVGHSDAPLAGGAVDKLADADAPRRGSIGRGGVHREGQSGAHTDIDHEGHIGMAEPSEPGRSALPRRTTGENGGAAAQPGRLCNVGVMGYSESRACGQGSSDFAGRNAGNGPERSRSGFAINGGMGDTDAKGLEVDSQQPARQERAPMERAGWSDIEWLQCRDGKARPTQPGLFPLAHGVPGRMGRLRAYGNAIVPQVAAAFIAACRN